MQKIFKGKDKNVEVSKNTVKENETDTDNSLPDFVNFIATPLENRHEDQHTFADLLFSK